MGKGITLYDKRIDAVSGGVGIALPVPFTADFHPLFSSLLPVSKSRGKNRAPYRSLEIARLEKWRQTLQFDSATVARKRRLAVFTRGADKAGQIPLNRAATGVFEIGPHQTAARLQQIFLMRVAMQRLFGKSKLVNLCGDLEKTTPQDGQILIAHYIPPLDLVQPARNLRKRTEVSQFARICAQCPMQFV